MMSSHLLGEYFGGEATPVNCRAYVALDNHRSQTKNEKIQR